MYLVPNYIGTIIMTGSKLAVVFFTINISTTCYKIVTLFINWYQPLVLNAANCKSVLSSSRQHQLKQKASTDIKESIAIFFLLTTYIHSLPLRMNYTNKSVTLKCNLHEIPTIHHCVHTQKIFFNFLYKVYCNYYKGYPEFLYLLNHISKKWPNFNDVT